MTFKNIRIKMKSGKSRMQRVQVLASGKYKFVKNIKSSRSSKSKKSTPKRKSGSSSSRKGGRRMGKSITQTAFKWIRVAALIAPEAAEIMQYGLTSGSIRTMISNKTGFNIETKTFDASQLIKGWGPYLGAVLATYGIPKIASIIRRL